MIDQLAKQLFTDIHQKLNQLDGPELPASQIKATIESALKKLNLVTREEFDAQQSVLIRTREKLETLEKKLDELESRD